MSLTQVVILAAIGLAVVILHASDRVCKMIQEATSVLKTSRDELARQRADVALILSVVDALEPLNDLGEISDNLTKLLREFEQTPEMFFRSDEPQSFADLIHLLRQSLQALSRKLPEDTA